MTKPRLLQCGRLTGFNYFVKVNVSSFTLLPSPAPPGSALFPLISPFRPPFSFILTSIPPNPGHFSPSLVNAPRQPAQSVLLGTCSGATTVS